MWWECVISSVLSRHSKNLKRRRLKPLDSSVLQLCCIEKIKESRPKRRGKGGESALALGPLCVCVFPPLGLPCVNWARQGGESALALGPLFVCVFPPLGLPCVNWARQECCWCYLRSSGPPTCLCSIFLGFSVPCLLATAILGSFFLF